MYFNLVSSTISGGGSSSSSSTSSSSNTEWLCYKMLSDGLEPHYKGTAHSNGLCALMVGFVRHNTTL